MSDARAEAAIRAALRQTPPRLPVGDLYDDVGARLYAQIIEQPEYDLFRTDRRLVEQAAETIVKRARPTELFELGAGPGRKIRALLDAGAGAGGLERCVQFDIQRDFVDASLARLTASYPTVGFEGRVGDFLVDLGDERPAPGRLVVCFGGTLGNLERRDALRLLRLIRGLLTDGGHVVSSLALETTPEAMVGAYRDAAGLNDAFGLNTLKVVNHRWGGDFDPDAFAHVPVWVPERSMIEMRLVAQRPTRARIDRLGIALSFAPGDWIVSDISARFTPAGFDALLTEAGFAPATFFTEPTGRMALTLAERA